MRNEREHREMTLSQLAALPPITMNHWDTVNATFLDVVNASMVKQNKVPADFKQSVTGAMPVEIYGSWKGWSLVQGSSGGLLKMKCEIGKGAAFYPGTTSPYRLDSATQGLLDMSADGLTVTARSGQAPSVTDLDSAFGVTGRQTGKFYFEVSSETDQTVIGLAPANASKGFFPESAEGYGFHQNGFFFNAAQLNAMKTAYGVAGGRATYAWRGAKGAPAVAGVAVDFDAKKIWFRGGDGSWLGTNADPVKGTGEAFAFTTTDLLFPAVAIGPNDSATLNFGATAFAHGAPAGFDTFKPGRYVALDGAVATAEITLAQVPATGKTVNLKANGTGSATMPAVVVSALVNAAGTAFQTMDEQNALQAWFNANISAFENIFHTVDIDDGLSKGDKFAWLKPTKIDYAAADIPMSNPVQTVFAILAMTESRDDPALASQVDPAIMSGMPGGTNSVVALSKGRMTAKILLPAADKLFPGSKPADFTLDALGLEVTNANAVKWREIELQDGTKVTPDVPAGGFKMRLEGRSIVMEFHDMAFDYPGWKLPGTETVKIGFTQRLYLVFEKRTDGKHVLVASNKNPDDPKDNELPKIEALTVDYHLDDAARTFEDTVFIFSVLLSVLTLGLGVYAAGSWAVRAGTAAEGAVNGIAGGGVQGANNAALDGTQMVNMGDQVNIGGHIYDNVGAMLAAGDAAAINDAAGASSTIGACMFAPRFAITFTVLGVVAGLLDAGAWATWGVAQSRHIGKGDIDKVGDQFTTEHMLDKLLASYEWPETANWKLKEATVSSGNLLLYGELS